ncbi:MAG: prolyl oligopeptidase family serine peptidase [Oscillospiraceae bacterium]|nr:prolyl oligopeptidase family serine peptidase [Oscillospiraceae bacterium]
MIIKRVFCLLISLCLVFASSSCSNKNEIKLSGPVTASTSARVTTATPITTAMPTTTAVPTTTQTPAPKYAPAIYIGSNVMFNKPDIIEKIKANDMYFYKFSYASDSEKVIGFFVRPIDCIGKLPIIIYNRGGNRSYGENTYEYILSLGFYFARKGYIFAATQYRGVDGGTGIEQFGGDDLDDVFNLLKIVKGLLYADTNNIFMIGQSRGGMETYEACRNNTEINAAVIDSGPSDLFDTYSSRELAMKEVLKFLIGGTPDELPEEYTKRSAVKWANEIDVPLYILHSTGDPRVNYSQAVNMCNELEKYNKDYVFQSFDDSDHCHEIRTEEIINWLEKYKK